MKTTRHPLHWLPICVALFICITVIAMRQTKRESAATEGPVSKPTSVTPPIVASASTQKGLPAPMGRSANPAIKQRPEPITIHLSDSEQYEEVANIIEYFKNKPLPEHGPVRSVGDGIDSTDRNAKLAPDTSFARFRYEYEKHDNIRLLSDWQWADSELVRLDYEARQASGILSSEERTRGELLMRRRQAIVSILAQRFREEEMHERYQAVEVTYAKPATTRAKPER